MMETVDNNVAVVKKKRNYLLCEHKQFIFDQLIIETKKKTRSGRVSSSNIASNDVIPVVINLDKVTDQVCLTISTLFECKYPNYHGLI